jgi:CheY-like chemotaxis protein
MKAARINSSNTTAARPARGLTDARKTVRQCDEIGPQIGPQRNYQGESVRRRLRVLVLDDHREQTAVVASRFRSWGHIAIEVEDGQAALRNSAMRRPDVVFLALDLPDLDGGVVSRQIRLDFGREECLIIGVLEHADERLGRMCSAAGVDRVLAKPVDWEVVETLLALKYGRVNQERDIRT